MIYEAINKYRSLERISFAMPGHKGGRGINFDPRNFDITELEDGVDLHHPNAPVEASLEFLKKFYQTDFSLYITGGSTAGIFIMLAAACKPGDTVAIGRGCHLSVINACIFLGLKAVIIPQDTDEMLNVLKPVTCEKILRLFENYSCIRAVVITSPTYYGECADIASVADIVHRHKIPLLVDEAHGAHFKSCNKLPDSAVDLGADICVQSAHKTLDAFTPSAFLHVKSEFVDSEAVKKAAVMRETSSPPYYQVASAELAVKKLRCDPYSHIADVCSMHRRTLKAQTRIVMPEGPLFDSTRLVFCFANYNVSGFKVNEILRRNYNVECEAADFLNVICIATPSNTDEEIKTLFEAVKKIVEGVEEKKSEFVYKFDSFSEINPSQAFYAAHISAELYDSVGSVAAESVFVYPPGIPIIYPGEGVTKNAVNFIKTLERSGAEIIGKETFCIVSK